MHSNETFGKFFLLDFEDYSFAELFSDGVTEVGTGSNYAPVCCGKGFATYPIHSATIGLGRATGGRGYH